MWYKRVLLFLLIIIVVSGSLFGFVVLKDFKKAAKKNSEKKEEVTEVVEEKTEDDYDEEEQEYEDVDEAETHENPFGDIFKKENMIDLLFQDYIHKMSHQKIIADEKWGFYLITDERIEWLLEALDETTEEIEYEEVYREILNKWKNNDFSEVDEDHNAIWEIQGGEIGVATGIKSEEEERRYIEETEEGK